MEGTAPIRRQIELREPDPGSERYPQLMSSKFSILCRGHIASKNDA